MPEWGCELRGPALGLPRSAASRTFEAGDISPRMVEAARRHYGERVRVLQFSAEKLPFPDRSKDVILLFEAITTCQTRPRS